MEIKVSQWDLILKPRALEDKENLSGYWSRRITDEHRIVYTVDNEKRQVEIYSLRDHY